MATAKRIPLELVIGVLLVAALAVVSLLYVSHVRTNAAVLTDELHAKFSECSHLRIESLILTEDPNSDPLLFETSDIDEVNSLVRTLALSGLQDDMSCACVGTLKFELYTGDDLTAAFSLHHGERIRLLTSRRSGDLALSRSCRKDLKSWLREKGINRDMYCF